MSELAWAAEEFGAAELGDARRARRIVQMGAQAARTPGGLLSNVFGKGAAAEGAYRAMENDAFEYTALAQAAGGASFQRAFDEPILLAPIDGTSLTLESVPDGELGPVGNQWSAAEGIHAIDCLLVTEAGIPAGLGGLHMWSREAQPRVSRTTTYGQGKSIKKAKSPERPIGEKESHHWGTVMEQALSTATEKGFRGRLWFQADAGADFGHMLASAPLVDAYVTVRSAHDRNVFGEHGHLVDEVMSVSPVGHYQLHVPETQERAARVAKIEVRVTAVLLRMKLRGEKGIAPAPFCAVSAREVSSVPKGVEPIDWLLLTTFPAETFTDALRVLEAYAKRWRVEEVHKAWKSITGVEDVALHSFDAAAKWATILLSVAIRIERLKYLARSEAGDSDATVGFAEDELLIIRDHAPRKGPRSEVRTLAQAVGILASMGGYLNPKQGPPGSITIGRGLARLAPMVEALRRYR